MSSFSKATKKKAKARVGLMGPSGSGKTYTGLEIATTLGKRVAVIDTERGSSSLYSDVFDFDVCELQDFAPASYIKKLREAESEGFDVVLIDSLSHAWSGPGGVLEMVDDLTAASRSKNAFNEGWRKATPEHNRLVEALLQSPCHLVTTMRTKVEYVLQEDERGKKIPTKVGMQPVQRADLDYEFTITCDIDRDHVMRVDKTRCSALSGKSFQRDGVAFANILNAWLLDGTDAPAVEPLIVKLRKSLEAANDKDALDRASAEVSASKTALSKEDLKLPASVLNESAKRIAGAA
jgi:hypothetical protein